MPSYIRIETDGEASPADFVAMWDEILQSAFWRPGLPVLLDNRQLKPLRDPDAFTASSIKYFAENASRLGNTCISTIGSLPDNFKYARQFQYGTRLRGCDVILQLFGSETQAVKWLDHYSTVRDQENGIAA